jgi:hypothetical protein
MFFNQLAWLAKNLYNAVFSEVPIRVTTPYVPGSFIEPSYPSMALSFILLSLNTTLLTAFFWTYAYVYGTTSIKFDHECGAFDAVLVGTAYVDCDGLLRGA